MESEVDLEIEVTVTLYVEATYCRGTPGVGPSYSQGGDPGEPEALVISRAEYVDDATEVAARHIEALLEQARDC